MPDSIGAANRNEERPKPSGMTSTAASAVAVGRRGLQQHVAAGDADVEGAGGDVDGDVARAQVEELGVVVGVVDREVLGAAALAVAALGEHLGRGLAQDALVGHGDAQHGERAPAVGGRGGGVVQR